MVAALPSTSRSRGTGFAKPQAARPPRGAGSYAKRATVGAPYSGRQFFMGQRFDRLRDLGHHLGHDRVGGQAL